MALTELCLDVVWHSPNCAWTLCGTHRAVPGRCVALTELCLDVVWQQQQLVFVQHESDVEGVTAQPVDARQELDRSLELRRQEEHAEVEERLLVGAEVTFT